MAKLGELFVDLGVNTGNALNALTNFSIKFLALKTMAGEVGKVFDGLFGDVVKYGQSLDKMSKSTGMSTDWLQKMKNRAEQTGTSLETVISTIQGLQTENAKILMGEGNISPYQKLNIDMSRMRAPAQLLDEIMSKVMRLQPAFQQAMLSELGISEDILFMYSQKNIKINDSLLLTKQEVEDLNDMNKEWIALKQTVESGYNKALASSAGKMSGVLKTIREMTSAFVDLKNNSGGWGEALVAELDIFINYIKKLSEDSKFFKVLTGFVENLKSLGGILGEAVASAVFFTQEGFSEIKDWDRIKKDKNTLSEKNKKPFLERTVGYLEDENGLNQEESPFWDKVVNFLNQPDNKSGTIEIDTTSQDSSLDYLKQTPPLNTYNSGGVVYNDNSQTTINTSEGTREYERLNREKIDKTKSQIGTVEMFGRRG